MASFIERMVGAAMLKSATFEEVEADKSATAQALGVVLLGAVASGLGKASSGVTVVAYTVCGALIGWVLWSALTWLIGTKLLATPETQSNIGELLRTTGFAASPGVIRILAAFPLIGPVIEFVALIWTLAAMVVAVRQALDYRGTGRALAVCAIGWLINLAIVMWGLVLVGVGTGVIQSQTS